MVRNLTKYTDQFLNHFFKYLPYFGFLSAFAPPNPDFLKMRIFLKKVVRDVILLIMNISANFESSTIIRKWWPNVPPRIFNPWPYLPHGPHQPFHQCQPRSHGGWYQTFQKMYYIKMCLKCVLGPK